MRAPVAPSGWPERDPAAVRVHVPHALLEPRVPQELQRDRREGLVHLDHGDVVPAEPGPRQRALRRLRVAVQHQSRVDSREPERDEAGPRLQARAASRRPRSPPARRQRRRRSGSSSRRSPFPPARRRARARPAPRATCPRAESRRRRTGSPHAGSRPRPERSRARTGPRRSPRARAGATRTSTRRAPRARAPTRSAISSAEIPCGTISQRSSSSSERSPPLDPIGTRDIDSTPADTTRSSWPDHTAAAALKFVCIEEPHWRSTVVPAHRVGPAGHQRRHPPDVPALLAHLRDAAHLHVLDVGRVEPSPLDESVQHLACQLVRPHRRERPVPLPDRRADGVDDQRIRHPRQRIAASVTTADCPSARARPRSLELDPGAGDEILDRAARRAPRRRRASAATRAPMCTAIPPSLPSTRSHSPVWSPARISMPSARTASRIDGAHADGARRPVERREEPVAGRVDLAAAEALELAPDERVVPLEQVAPAPVAELRRPLGRADDVGEEHRREHAVGLGHRGATPVRNSSISSSERVLVADPRQVVVARQLDEPRAGDLLGDVAALLDVHDRGRRVRCRTSVGTWIVGSTCADVDLACSCAVERAAPRRGSRACGGSRATMARKRSSSARLGAQCSRPTAAAPRRARSRST